LFVLGTYYSTYFKVEHQTLFDKGVFDGCLDADSKLHVDPMLLKQCNVPEFKGAYDAFFDFFNRFVDLTPAVKEPKLSDPFFKKMVEFFTLSEIPNTGLGYSEKTCKGRGISGTLSIQLANSAYSIIKEGITNPKIFGWMQLIEDNIGADRISDMTLAILQPFFLRYTERVSFECGIDTKEYVDKDDNTYNVPYYQNKPVHFVPMQLLTNLPVAHTYDDVEDACDYNNRLKHRIGQIIGVYWQEYRKYSKKQWKQIIIENPECYHTAIELYDKISSSGYDFNKDESGVFYNLKIQECTKRFPLNFLFGKHNNPADEIYEFSKAICDQYRHVVEDRRASEIFYRQHRQPDETDWQMLLLIVAESYQKGGNFDIHVSREANPGVGEIDFQLTRGSKANTCIEIKRSTNKDLLHGYRQQLAAYMKAENADHGIFIVILEDDSEQQLKEKLRAVQDDMNKKGEYIPDVIFIDGRRQLSASNPNYSISR